MKVNKYPDGTTYINNTKLGQQVFKLNEYSDIWKLKQFVDAFHSEYDTITSIMNPNIIIPNLIDAQADRRFNKGESFGLKLVIQELAKMKANFSIFHPHNPEAVEMGFEVLDSKVNIIDNSEFISKVLWNLNGNYPSTDIYINLKKDKLTLMSSDAGGFKPLMKLCDKLKWKGKTYSAAKSRNYIQGKSKLTQQIPCTDFKGKDILIVDDICVYGGTFKGLATLLKEKNCGKLYLATSHITIQNHKGNDTVFDYFEKVFTTNSKFDEYFVEDSQGQPKPPTNLEIIKLF